MNSTWFIFVFFAQKQFNGLNQKDLKDCGIKRFAENEEGCGENREMDEWTQWTSWE